MSKNFTTSLPPQIQISSIKFPNKLVRSTFQCINKNIKHTKIPFSITITPEHFESTTEVLNNEVVRCEHCKSYINKYVEIIEPGLQWKCNLCFTINKADTPFEKSFYGNKTQYKMYELNNDTYEICAPSSYVLKAPSAPCFVFLIELTEQSLRNGMFYSVLEAIKNNVDNLYVKDKRTKYSFVFFNSCSYLLHTNGTICVLPDDVPNILEDDILFDIDSVPNININLLKEEVNTGCNYFGALQACKRILKNGGTVCSFIATLPEKNKYEELSEHFIYLGLCVNLFVFSNINIDLKDLYILIHKTSGMLFYYPNFVNDEYFTHKFSKDFTKFTHLNTNRDVICKVRPNKGIKIISYSGSLTKKNNGILGFTHFYTTHGFAFECEVEETYNNEVYFQVAMLKTINAQRVIRVINFAIPVYENVYGNLDVNAITHTFALKLIKDPKFNVVGQLKSIISAYQDNTNQKGGLRLPPCLHALPLLTLSLLKCIPFRQSTYTPQDYKVFYQYLLNTSYTKLVDTIIHPTLLPLHYLLENDVDNIYEYSVNLSLYSLEVDGLYLLDTGVNIFVFISCQCENTYIFDDIKNGRFVPNFDNSVYGIKMKQIIGLLTENRFLTPNFVLVKDDGNSNVFRDIFMSYFVEDAGCGLDNYENFVAKLK